MQPIKKTVAQTWYERCNCKTIIYNKLAKLWKFISTYCVSALQGQLKKVLQSVQAMASPPPSRSNTMERKKVMCILLHSIALWSNHPFDLITKLPFFVKEFRGKSVKKQNKTKTFPPLNTLVTSMTLLYMRIRNRNIQ